MPIARSHVQLPPGFAMLDGGTKPDILHFTEYFDQFSNRRKHPSFSIPSVTRFSMKRSESGAGSLGPGQYRVCRDFPENLYREMPCNFSTKCVVPAPKYTFNVDERIAKDGCLKGISNFYGKRNPAMGPGYYNAPSLESRVNKRAKETQEAIRERKVLNLSPGPGTYTTPSKWDDMDREQSKVTKKLAKKAVAGSWVAQQYKQIFACMMHGASSAPVLKASGGATRKVEPSPPTKKAGKK